MWIGLLVLRALSCELLSLPIDIDYFSPAFLKTGKLEGTGRFLVSSGVVWNIEITQDSWIRVTAEPELFLLHLILTSTSILDMQTAKPGGLATISKRLSPGKYLLKFDVDSIQESNDKNSLCSVPNVWVNLGISGLDAIPNIQPVDEFYSSEFPNLEYIDKVLLFSSFASFYHKNYISTSESSNLQKTYDFNLPKTTDTLSQLGITGMWKLTFTLRN
jgi:hypothetical protein